MTDSKELAVKNEEAKEYVQLEEQENKLEEVESIRYKLLMKVIDKALKKSLECLNEESLLKSYPSFNNRSGKKYIKNSLNQINDFFLKNCIKEIDIILEEKNVKTKLHELDEIIEKAERLKKRNRPEESLNIEELTRQYLVDYNIYSSKLDYAKQLEGKLKQYENDNRTLLKELKEINENDDEKFGDLEDSIKQMKALKASMIYDENGNDVDLQLYDQLFEGISRKQLFE